MRLGMVLAASAGCVVTALLFAKRLGTDWSSAIMAVLFAGAAGALLIAATS